MSKIKIVIEYDHDIKAASVSIGGKNPNLWEDAELTLHKDTEENTKDGWRSSRATGGLSLHLSGFLPSLVSR